jgi:L-lactate utilization protein LutB
MPNGGRFAALIAVCAFAAGGTSFSIEIPRTDGSITVDGQPDDEAWNHAKVMRLVQLGLKPEALACNTIWICVGCHTCSIQCPMAIDIAAVMDVLREKALAEGAAVPEPDVLNFHREVLNSIERYGRTHKIEIMMRYKLRKLDLLSDWQVGLKMLAKRKLDLTPSRVERVGDVKKLFEE